MKLAPTDAAVAERAHAVMERHFRHLRRLVDDLIDAGRITSNRLALRMGPVD